MKLKVKKNDTIRVIAGKDKGKTGKVLRANPEAGTLVVEGINLVTKHVRARKAGEKGQKTYFPKPLNISKVMLVCDKCGDPTRVGIKVLEGDTRKKRERVCKSCNQLIGV